MPVAPSAIPSGSTSACSCARRSASAAGTSANVSQRPVLTSTSEAISSPTRFGSSDVPLRRRLHLLEPVDEPERRRVEQRELLLDRDGEVGAALEALARRGEQLLVADPLLVTHARSVVKRFEQAARDSGPAPAVDGGVPGRCAQRCPVGVRQREQLAQLRCEVGRVAGGEAREVAQVGRILLLQPFRDLGQAGVARDERRRAGGGRLGGDHAERLREDRRDDRGVREREQVDEVPVLERAGEERARPAEQLELVAVVAEADDDGARAHVAQRLEQDVDALVVEQLPEVDDGRLVAGEELGQALGVPLVRQPLARVAGIRRVAPRLGEQAGERLVARTRPPLVDVDAGRHLVDAVDVADDVLEHLPDVRRADEDGLRAPRAPPVPRRRAPRCRASSTRAPSRAP